MYMDNFKHTFIQNDEILNTVHVKRVHVKRN